MCIEETAQKAIKSLISNLSKGLRIKDNTHTNVRDILSIYLLAHVIYIDIDEEEIKCELNRAYSKLIDDSKLLDISIPALLIECINKDRYYNMMPPVLKEYWSNFLQTIEYFLNPTPDMEQHIDYPILKRAEFNAEQLVKAELHYGQDL
jgi:hypothetical protein